MMNERGTPCTSGSDEAQKIGLVSNVRSIGRYVPQSLSPLCPLGPQARKHAMEPSHRRSEVKELPPHLDLI